jgi:hypothetical protein
MPNLLQHLDPLAKKWAQLDTALPGLSELREISIWIDHSTSTRWRLHYRNLLIPFTSLAKRPGIEARAEFSYSTSRVAAPEEPVAPFTIVQSPRERFRAEVNKQRDFEMTYEE